MNTIHIPKPYFPKIHLNVILPSMLPLTPQKIPREFIAKYREKAR
jgi:hypothetical protein